MKLERVVVTGLGAVTPIGNTVKEFWDGLIEGRCGIGAITHFDTAGFKVTLAAEVKDFDPGLYMDKKEARRLDPFCRFAIAAARQALDDSGLDMAKEDVWRVGAITGSGIGGLDTLESDIVKMTEKGPGRVSPFMIPMMIPDMAAGMASILFGMRGANYSISSACASSNNSIGEAFLKIKYGRLDACLTGGSEAVITPVSVAGFSNMTAMSTSNDPNAALLPFDARRSGFIMGEGAGMLLLESLTHAKARGAKIYGEIVGYGATADNYHITSPDPEGEGGAMAMRLAMEEGGLAPSEVGYLNAHGTGTPVNDKFETLAIKKAFGEAARSLSVSSTKSMTGHLLGGAGAVEAIASLLAIRNGLIPPTINLTSPDPECDLDYTPNKAVKKNITAALSNSIGFGGHNACVAMKKYDE